MHNLAPASARPVLVYGVLLLELLEVLLQLLLHLAVVLISVSPFGLDQQLRPFLGVVLGLDSDRRRPSRGASLIRLL